jgi:23S rRNA (adenine2030-N6)-methyltransferase
VTILLSYRHAFHAGNHADVLKHFVLQQVLRYTRQKDKPFWYIDTHAGAGMYALNDGYATKNAEFSTGIMPLLTAQNLPTQLQTFVDLIRTFNLTETQTYPGSPAIAETLLRADDKMRLFELHPTDYAILNAHFAQYKRQVKVEMQNGFVGLKAILPPPTRRAVVLIDPPYEDKQDYQHLVSVCEKALSIFETGTYIVWYPLLQRTEPLEMINTLKALHLKNWLDVSMTVQAPSNDGFGMFGSGIFIINPPWTMPAILNETMPTMVSLLAQDSTANYQLEYVMQ